MTKDKDKIEKVLGTNCYNCKFIAKDETSVDQIDLNDEGGLDPRNPEEMERARKADLITLPGGSKSEIKDFVTMTKWTCSLLFECAAHFGIMLESSDLGKQNERLSIKTKPIAQNSKRVEAEISAQLEIHPQAFNC